MYPGTGCGQSSDDPREQVGARSRLAVGFAVSVDVLLTEQWNTHQLIFSASSMMISAGPRT